MKLCFDQAGLHQGRGVLFWHPDGSAQGRGCLRRHHRQGFHPLYKSLASQINLLLQELDAANKKEVEGALGGFLKSGEKALISYAVDATIVGGMVVSWTTSELS